MNKDLNNLKADLQKLEAEQRGERLKDGPFTHRIKAKRGLKGSRQQVIAQIKNMLA